MEPSKCQPQDGEFLYCPIPSHIHVAHCYHAQRVFYEVFTHFEKTSMAFIKSLQESNCALDTALCARLGEQLDNATVHLCNHQHTINFEFDGPRPQEDLRQKHQISRGGYYGRAGSLRGGRGGRGGGGGGRGGHDIGRRWICPPIPTIQVDKAPELSLAQKSISDFYGMFVQGLVHCLLRLADHKPECMTCDTESKSICNASQALGEESKRIPREVAPEAEHDHAEARCAMRVLLEMLQHVWTGSVIATCNGYQAILACDITKPLRPALAFGLALLDRPSTSIQLYAWLNAWEMGMRAIQGQTWLKDHEGGITAQLAVHNDENSECNLDSLSPDTDSACLFDDPAYGLHLIEQALTAGHVGKDACCSSYTRLVSLLNKLRTINMDQRRIQTGVLFQFLRRAIEAPRVTYAEELETFLRALQTCAGELGLDVDDRSRASRASGWEDDLDDRLKTVISHFRNSIHEIDRCIEWNDRRLELAVASDIGSWCPPHLDVTISFLEAHQESARLNTTSSDPYGIICDRVLEFISFVVALLTDSDHDRMSDECTESDTCSRCAQTFTQIVDKYKQLDHAVKQICNGLSAGAEARTGEKLRAMLQAVWLDARRCLPMDEYGDSDDDDDDDDDDYEDRLGQRLYLTGEMDYDAVGDEESHHQIMQEPDLNESESEPSSESDEHESSDGDESLVVDMRSLTVEDAMDLDD